MRNVSLFVAPAQAQISSKHDDITGHSTLGREAMGQLNYEYYLKMRENPLFQIRGRPIGPLILQKSCHMVW